MCEVRADESGNVALPKEILEQLKIKPGDLVRITMSLSGAAIVRARNGSITDLAGMLYREGQEPVPIEKMRR